MWSLKERQAERARMRGEEAADNSPQPSAEAIAAEAAKAAKAAAKADKGKPPPAQAGVPGWGGNS